MTMPDDYFEERFYLTYYPELFFTEYNIDHKAVEHYENFGK